MEEYKCNKYLYKLRKNYSEIYMNKYLYYKSQTGGVIIPNFSDLQPTARFSIFFDANIKKTITIPPSKQNIEIYDFIKIANNSYHNRNTEIGSGLYYATDYKQIFKNIYTKYNITLDDVFIDDMNGSTNFNYFQKYKYKKDSDHYIRRGGNFKAKEGVKASDALFSFIEGPTLCDCGNVIQISVYYYLYNLLGKDLFDDLFTKMLMPFIITQYNYDKISFEKDKERFFGNPLYFLFDDFRDQIINKEFTIKDVKKGDIIHIKGVANYQYKHLVGNFSGHNLLCIDDDKFVGFNPSDQREYLSYNEIIELLINEYNKDVSEETIKSSKKLYESIEKMPHDSTDYFYKKSIYDLHLASRKHNVTLSNENIDGLIHCIRFNQQKLKDYIAKNNLSWYKQNSDILKDEQILIPINKTDIIQISNIPFESLNNTFENFKINQTNKSLFNLMYSYARTIINNTEPYMLIISGNPGIGKTHLTISVAKEVSKYKKVLFINETDIRTQGINVNTLSSDIDLYIIDDINSTYEIKDNIKDLVHKILQNKKALLLSSNVSIDNIQEVLPYYLNYDHPYINNFYIMDKIQGESYRKPWTNTVFYDKTLTSLMIQYLAKFTGASAAGILIENAEITRDKLNVYEEIYKKFDSLSKVYCIREPKNPINYQYIDFFVTQTKSYDVLILKIVQKELNTIYQLLYLINGAFDYKRKCIVVVDDMDKFIEQFKQFCITERSWLSKFGLKIFDRMKIILPGLYEKIMLDLKN